MNIVAVNSDKGIAPDGSKGASIHLRSLLSAFCRNGHQVTLHSRRPPVDSSASPDFDIRVGDEVADITESIIKTNADFVFERYSLNNTHGLQAARQTSRILALEVNAPLFQEASLHRPQTITSASEEIERMLFQEADAVFPVSTNLAGHIAHTRGEGSLTRVLPNGVQSSLFTENRFKRRIQSPWTLAFLGHPKPWHGTHILPAVIANLVNAKMDVQLLVIGGGVGAETLQEDFEALGQGGRIKVTGPLDHTAAIGLLKEADLSLAPYDDLDDFYFSPLKIMESMAAGVPIITSKVGDIPEITAGRALFAKPGDAKDFANKIKAVLESKTLGQEMSESGYAHVMSHHTWEMNARVIVDDAKILMEGRSSA